jgi:agmatine deiminase
MPRAPNVTATPREAGFYMPAEWEAHDACWLAWPHSEALWGDELAETQASFVRLCAAIGDPDPASGQPRGETVEVLVNDDRDEAVAGSALAPLAVRFRRVPYGDIWLRDTAPVFVRDAARQVAAVRFTFNGWGGKYLFEHDDRVATRVAEQTGVTTFTIPWVLEGGSIEVDGQGTCLTTQECLLNPNRNPGMSRAAIETGLRDALGVERILWLDRGLLNDHTDGHVDTLARFVAPGVVACMTPAGADDPNGPVLDAVARDLASCRDARGRRLDLVHIPSPGRVCNREGVIVPASYVNFYIGNHAVVVPTYDVPNDDIAVEAIGGCFPDRRTVGVPARALVASGGGAFHCITQQQPASGGDGPCKAET